MIDLPVGRELWLGRTPIGDARRQVARDRRPGRTSGSVTLFDRMAIRCIMKIGVDYIAELYVSGDLSIREVAEILQFNFRQTMDILEKRVGGNVEPEQEAKALNLAKRQTERS